MNCPVCQNVSLLMSERHGIEIDYCPKCRGVWLDRGELDKLIEKGTSPTSGYPPPPRPSGYDTQHSDRSYRGKPYKKREGFLSDLFDFD